MEVWRVLYVMQFYRVPFHWLIDDWGLCGGRGLCKVVWQSTQTGNVQPLFWDRKTGVQCTPSEQLVPVY